MNDVHLTIGALSKATEVPINTLRTWERRYGFPNGARTDGGHRLYPPDVVDHVRLVVRALDAGMRPAQVLPASADALRTLLGGAAAPTLTDPVEVWLEATRKLDGTTLIRGFSTESARLGLPTFLDQRAIPFLTRVGEEWCAGHLRVLHEHFASARLEDFLAGKWRPLSDASVGTPVVCATLPGDHHHLSLHMAAAVLAVSGWRVVYLGADAPVLEIADAAKQVSAELIVVSVGASTPDAAGHLRALRAATDVRIVIGGRGAPEVEGVERLARMTELSEAAGVG
jgi:methylmalonyl-CoA mutase cobalamin-binding subunit